MKKSKIHSATITGLELYYEGSITIDKDILDAADILPNEQVQIVNLNNGARLISYAISGEKSSGIIELNGPAARLGAVGDKIIIISYGQFEENEISGLNSKVVLLNNNNEIIS